MRESFEKHLGGFNEIAKNEVIEDVETGDVELQELLEQFSKEDNSTIDAQAEIFELQREKQLVMQELKEENHEKKEGKIEIVCKEDRYFAVDNNGEEIEITKGEILTDGDWGAEYYLDPDSMPRNLQRRYLVENTKRKLRNLLDRQIAIQEISQARDANKMKAYEKIKERRENDKETKEMGLVAETMVKNFLKKLSIDYNVAFDVLEADAYQDVEQKLDFIIARRPYFRGVEVNDLNSETHETDHENVGSLGVQFTINSNKEVLDRKRRQIEKVKAKERGENDIHEDIILVHIDMKGVGRLYEEWSKTKSVGGPDKLLEKEVKKAIFHKTLEDIIPQEELNEEWIKISQDI